MSSSHIDHNELEASKEANDRPIMMCHYLVQERVWVFFIKNLKLQITIYNFFMMQHQSIIILESDLSSYAH